MSSVMLEQFLNDPYYPPSVRLEDSEKRRMRAIEEVDGMRLGLRYLDQVCERFEKLHPSSKRYNNQQCHEKCRVAPLASSNAHPYSPLFYLTNGSDRIGEGAGHCLGTNLPGQDALNGGYMCLGGKETRGIPSPGAAGGFQKQAAGAGCAREDGPSPKDTVERLPNPEQWAALQQVSQEMAQQYDQMVEACIRSNLPQASHLLQSYENANDLRDRGFLVFREVLEKKAAANRVADVFALAAVSYVTSILLVERGRMRQEEILWGLQIWRDSIYDPAEKELFEYVAQEMWPEAKLQLSSINPFPEGCSFADTLSSISAVDLSADMTGAPGSHVPNVGPNFQFSPPSTATMLNSTDVPTDPGAGCDGNWLSTTAQDFALTVTSGTYQEWEFSNLVSPAPAASHVPGSPSLCFPSDCTPEALDFIQAGQAFFAIHDFTAVPSAGELENTALFLAVLTFLDDHGEFLCNLAGCGNTGRDDDSAVGDVDDSSQFLAELQGGFLRNLEDYASTRSGFMLACHSATETYAEWGFLRTTEQVKTFVVNFARVSFVACARTPATRRDYPPY